MPKSYNVAKMKYARTNYLVGIVYSYIIDSPTSANITYVWNIGSMLGLVLLLQIITGITLGFNYTGNITEAFNSIEEIHREIWYGGIIRYMHSNGAAQLFILLWIHIGKGIYFRTYMGPRIGVWYAGVLILIIMMASAFLGYTLPFGSMSY
jgi:ubiquinol-cytochrome c reductase cytochrome b subunit